MSRLRSAVLSQLIFIVATAGLLWGTSALGDSALLDLLTGEYNNNEQVWQQKLNGEAPVQRRHWRFERLNKDSLRLAIALGQSATTPAWELSLAEEDGATALRPVGESSVLCYYRWRPQADGFAGQA